ncbi:lysophospholipid acyltransferase family protein [Rhodococcus cerastii]|uniref:Lysophospholipid acyltransferase family protein n=3 Tax=Rhodococcus TaxID=1827 RepID=A0ABU4AY07_9NOCA|nr:MULTISPECIES: lysophospholipid acyltransferase family protein [Rhodococcus]MDV6231141.1 lysophospholipid acyltransferase family protein [Rhodococcus cercidiphylli]MDV6304044.1 lysophospholipid acyltransferase family protein [Rhodococcus cerastii]MDV8076639.1 lysophospholipid acyltransferase family protein [Rhodococcus sp. IEGM 1370]
MSEVAKVIPLHGGTSGRSARAAAGSRERHPSAYADPREPTPLPAPAPADASAVTPSLPTPLLSMIDDTKSTIVDQISSVAEFVRRRLAGDYSVDEFGYDPHFADAVWLPLLRPLFDKWFRVEVKGIENIPSDGGALVVANHAGVVPVDALMASVAVRDHHPAHRPLRMLAADMAFEMPGVGTIARKAGHTLACNPDAERLLRTGEVAAVFPEGFKGIGKPFSERYKLQRFGRGGFVSAALRTGVPIIPCSIVGSEEIYPKIGDIAPLARLMGVPYFPVTPFFPHLGPLGLIPLPSKWYIEFGKPIPTDGYDSTAFEDPMVLFELTDHVRETIQHTLYRLLAKRRNVFLG